MKLAVCLYKLFPFGGLARDCVRILSLCYQQGADIDVFVMECEGDIPEGFNVEIINAKGISNHAKVANYIEQLQTRLKQQEYDLVIGFNKMPGLNLYYAADPCYIDRVKSQSNYPLIRLTGRVKQYSQNERAVFGSESDTVALMISDIQQKKFEQHYQTPKERLVSLPPGIDPDRKRTADWELKRSHFRKDHQLAENDFVLLTIGTAFKIKGMDRSILALASLPDSVKARTKLFIVGEDDITTYDKLAKESGVAEQVTFFGGRSDIPEFLLGCDLFIHPARKENTGTVILEALIAGLPTLISGACGYAGHIQKSNAGLVSPEPFDQNRFNQQLLSMADKEVLNSYSENALIYADSEDLYSMPQKVASLIETMVEHKKGK